MFLLSLAIVKLSIKILYLSKSAKSSGGRYCT